jgi:hypothetical protein
MANNEELEDIFIKQTHDFINELNVVFYDMTFIDEGKKYINAMNESYLMRNWKKNIADQYEVEIDAMNADLLIQKVETIGHLYKDAQSRMFGHIITHMKDLSPTSKHNIMMYISNITKIVNMYFIHM